MDSTTSQPYLFHRGSPERPGEESDSDRATINSSRALRKCEEQLTTSPPRAICRDSPQETSSILSSSAAQVTNRFAGSGAQPATTITQDRLVPLHPSVHFDAYNSRFDAGRDIGSRNVSQHGDGSQIVVGDQARVTINQVLPSIEHETLLRGIEAKLRTHVASDAMLSKATHGEPSLCYRGTRENLLEHILSWIEAENQQEASIAGRSKCIIGAPGSGKSTIMNTMVVNLLSDAARRNPGLISAHYCIRRSLPSTTDWSKVLPTVIPQLALVNYGVAKHVHTLLAETQQTGVFAQDFIEDLFLTTIRTYHKTVFVIIDALDEVSSPAPLAATLSRVIRLSSPNLRLLLASRNEWIVINSIDQDHILNSIRHMIPTEESIREVSDYITGRIRNGLREIFGSDPSWEGWPSKAQLQSLSDRADGLFIWASTAVDFILSQIRKRGARNRDRMIEDVGNIGMADVNSLYTFILRSYLENDEDESREATLQWMKSVLGLIVVAEHPLNLKAIIGLLGVDPNDFDVHHFVLSNRSILVAGTQPVIESTIPRFHKTFFDFITTHRAGEFYINFEEHHGSAAECAFLVMEKDLQFDICDLGHGSSLAEKDFSKTQEKYQELLKGIPDVLTYASTFWSYHLEKADKDFTVSSLGSVRAFLHNKLLFWLEIVIMADKTEEVGSWLLKLGVRLGSHRIGDLNPGDTNLAAFAADASLLIKKFRTGIRYSIPHIYISLLAFSPRCSIVADHYRAKVASMVIPYPRQMPLRWDGWDEDPTLSSDDSNIAASNTPDISSTNNVSRNNLAKSGADKSIDDLVRSGVTSLGFSPENEQRLAVAYVDGSIGVWNVEAESCVMSLVSSSKDYIGALYYSPDGSLLACSGLRGTTCVWSSQTGDMVLGPLYSGALGGSLVAFSSDHTLFTSRTASGNAVQVRDAHSSEVVARLCRERSDSWSWNDFLAYSPSATTIAVGSLDGYVEIWDVQSGELIFRIRPHRSHIRALSFSPDGRRLASASYDQTIRILDTNNRTYTQDTLRGHTRAINSICFSLDGRYIASGSDDRTIRIWDTKTGACVAGPIRGHTCEITAVAFSPDGIYLASGSDDGIVRLWDVRVLLAGTQSRGSNAPVGSGLTDRSAVDEEGWTLGRTGERLFWTPEPYRACIWRPSTVKIIGRHGFLNMIKPDLSKLVTGEEWKKCFQE